MHEVVDALHTAHTCRRHRRMRTGDTPMIHVDAHTVDVAGSVIGAALVRQGDEHRFKLQITAFEG